MTTVTTRDQLYSVSYYAQVTVTYKRPYQPPQTNTYFLACDRHGPPLSPDPCIDGFLKFNSICYTCPACPRFHSEHFHYEGESCTEKCNPLRLFYSPCLPVDDESKNHRCQLHFFPALRNPYCDHNTLYVPPHDFTPHFVTETQWWLAREIIFRAVQPFSGYEERILLGLPGHGYDDEWRWLNSQGIFGEGEEETPSTTEVGEAQDDLPNPSDHSPAERNSP